MEEKKFDLNSLIGFILLFALAGFYMYNNMPSKEEIEKQKQLKEAKLDSIKKVEELAKTKQVEISEIQNTTTNTVVNDSLKALNAMNKVGTFEYAATLPSAKDIETSITTNLLDLKFSNKGGQPSSVNLKNYKTYDNKPLYLIKNENALLNINFNTKDGRNLDTKDLYFEPTLTKDGKNQVLSMKLKISNDQYLEYVYTVKPDEYLIDFNINSKGLDNVFNTSKNLDLHWNLKTIRTEKSVKYENQYTDFRYLYNGDQWDYTMTDTETDAENVNWISYKKQFFSTILLADKEFEKATMSQENLVNDDKIDTVYTKQLDSKIPLSFKNNAIAENLQLYYGPNDIKVFDNYKDKKLNYNLAIGTSIFRTINRWLIMPAFNFFQKYVGSLGLVIILLTVFIKLLMSPLLYKSFLSSAKMKVIKPEIQEINDKLKGKENAMKRQQETMALQRKAGVNPMAGCIPALLQMPVFFALFRFFPTNIDLRQQSFLWATDLSAYDEIAKLPFGLDIPWYGSHIALFPILASITMYFYMKISQGQQAAMQQPAQEGMPDMQKMMKMMMYFSPIMMLFFFNSYGSGLSIYYFVSQLISIVIMLVIKFVIIDEKKIKAQIEVNKQRAPKKKSKFRQRLDEAMKQAQEQQEQRKKGNK